MKNSKKIMALSMATAMTLGSMSPAFALNVNGDDYSGVQVGEKFYTIQYIATHVEAFEAMIQNNLSNLILDVNGNSAKLMDFVGSGADDFDTWAAVPANQTQPNPTTLVKADATEIPVETSLEVSSVSAINGTEVTVTLANVPAELPAVNLFQISDSNGLVYAPTNIAAATTAGEYKLTLGTAIVGKGTLTVAYGNSSAELAFDTTLDGLTLDISIGDEDATLTADGADNTIIAVTALKDGVKDESFNGTIKFMSLKGASFAKQTVAFDKGVAQVQLTAMSSATAIVDTIIATISDADDLTAVGTSIQTNVSYVPTSNGGDTTTKVFITYAESDRSSDVYVQFNKAFDFADLYAEWAGDDTVIQVTDASATFQAIDLVKVDETTIKLVLDQGSALQDNSIITVDATGGGVNSSLITSQVKFNLVDPKAPEALSIATPDYRTIVAKFTEPVSNTTASVVGNWVLNGQQLVTADVVGGVPVVGRDSDGDNTPDVYISDSVTPIDNRNYVTIKLTSPGAQKLKAAGGANLLQAYNMIDYAGLSDTTGQNIATTQEFTFVTPEAPNAPTSTFTMQSPEQFLVTFSTDVQHIGGGDLVAADFALEYQNGVDGSGNPVFDGTNVITLEDAEATPANAVVKKVSETEYLIELEEDWTEKLDTAANDVNYYSPAVNDIQIKALKADIENLNGVQMAEDQLEVITMANDDVEPVIVTAEQNYDLSANPLKEITVTMSEPVQMVGSIVPAITPSQQQTAGAGVPTPTFEFVNADESITLEGQLQAASISEDDTTFIVEPVAADAASLTPGTWTLYVRSISDDIGNTSGTEKYDVVIEGTTSSIGEAKIIWADAHDNVDVDDDTIVDADFVHVQFGTQMSLDALKSTVYTINGKPLPVGTMITSNDYAEYDSNNGGALDATDLDGTRITITLPKDFLGDITETVGVDPAANPITAAEYDANPSEPHMLNVSKSLTDAQGNTIQGPTEVELTYELDSANGLDVDHDDAPE